MAAEDKVIGFLDELLRKSGREPYLDMADCLRGNASGVNGPANFSRTQRISWRGGTRPKQDTDSESILLFASSLRVIIER